MFKTLTLTLLVSLTSMTAAAVSMHPCTPTVRAQDTRINCRTNNDYVTIVVHTLMSRPISMCQGKNHIEYKTAELSFSDNNGQVFKTLSLAAGTFTYKLGVGNGRASFSSPSHKLNLKNCVTPMHGGFSVGN